PLDAHVVQPEQRVRRLPGAFAPDAAHPQTGGVARDEPLTRQPLGPRIADEPLRIGAVVQLAERDEAGLTRDPEQLPAPGERGAAPEADEAERVRPLHALELADDLQPAREVHGTQLPAAERRRQRLTPADLVG